MSAIVYAPNVTYSDFEVKRMFQAYLEEQSAIGLIDIKMATSSDAYSSSAVMLDFLYIDYLEKQAPEKLTSFEG